MSNIIKNPEISIVNGLAKTTSLAVAEFFEKRHDDVLKKIRSIINHIGNGWCPRNFAETQVERKTPTGGIVKDTIYEITRDGFALLAMGFTGKKALHWKLQYIKAFNAMESGLTSGVITPAMQNAFQQVVKIRSGGDRKHITYMWSRFNNHFKLGSYKQLSADRFEEALQYMSEIPIDIDAGQNPEQLRNSIKACMLIINRVNDIVSGLRSISHKSEGSGIATRLLLREAERNLNIGTYGTLAALNPDTSKVVTGNKKEAIDEFKLLSTCDYMNVVDGLKNI